MRVREARRNYRTCTMAIYSALNAARIEGSVNLGTICKAHKVSVSFPSVLRDRGFIIGKNGASRWNPEFDVPGDDLVEELRLETLARMRRSKPAPRPESPPGPVSLSRECVQASLPLTVLPRMQDVVADLVNLHRKTGALLEELGVEV